MPRGEYLQYGGQAIVEGVMMRSPRFFAVACRAPNGEIILHAEGLDKTWTGRQKWLKLPFLRGSLALLDAMGLGIRAMRFASKVQLDPAYQPQPAEASAMASLNGKPKTASAASDRIQDGAIGVTMVFSIVFGLLLFVYLPSLIAEYGERALGTHNGIQINFVSEVVKIVIFLGYIALIGQLKDVREIFKYHGAEHKAINTLEADQELVLSNCKNQTRLHPRCGTSFAIIVLLLGLIVFTFVPRYPVTGHQGGSALADVTVRFLLQLLLLPLIAGTAYELLRIAGKFRSQALVNALFKPGVWSQYLTTREPDPPQIEVALSALKAVIAAEEAAPAAAPVASNELESSPTVAVKP